MIHVPVFSMCLLAFIALALAMERHQMDVWGRGLASGATCGLRVAGWGALVLALIVVVLDQGWALGLVIYSGHTSVSAGLVFAALVVHGKLKIRR